MAGGAADEREARVDLALLEHRRQFSPRLHRPLEMASLPIPDELLVDIFIRLPNPADLARASAACVAFRRLIAVRSFLRQYRKLHAPPLLGFLEYQSFHPAVPPYPSASAATAVDLAADFSFSFLPDPDCDWVLHDICNGRVLLDRTGQQDTDEGHRILFTELVVCDTLHRHYLLLPPIPAHLAASVDDTLWRTRHRRCETFLASGGEDDDETSAAEETSFRVIWMARCRNKLVAFVFSSNTGKWRPISSQSWSDLFAGLLSSTVWPLFSQRQYVYGCFYWVMHYRVESKLLVLDTETMEFSIAEPPPEANTCCDLVMVEAGEGRPGMFVLADGTSDLSYFVRQNDGGSSSQWQKVKTISLGSSARLICKMEKHLLLYQRKTPLVEAGGFTLDIETFQLEKVCALGSPICKVHAYSNFPPSLLSSPTVSSGVEKGPEKEVLEQGCAARSSSESTRAGGQAED